MWLYKNQKNKLGHNMYTVPDNVKVHKGSIWSLKVILKEKFGLDGRFVSFILYLNTFVKKLEYMYTRLNS